MVVGNTDIVSNVMLHDWQLYQKYLPVTDAGYFSIEEMFPVQFLQTEGENIIIMRVTEKADDFVCHSDLPKNIPDRNALINRAAIITQGKDFDTNNEYVFLVDRVTSKIIYNVTEGAIVDWDAFDFSPPMDSFISTIVIYNSRYGLGIRKLYINIGNTAMLFLHDVTKDMIIPKVNSLIGAPSVANLFADVYMIEVVGFPHYADSFHPTNVRPWLDELQLDVLRKFRDKLIKTAKAPILLPAPVDSEMYNNIGFVKLSWIMKHKQIPQIAEFTWISMDCDLGVQNDNVKAISTNGGKIYFYLSDPKSGSVSELASALGVPFGLINIMLATLKDTDNLPAF